MFYGRDKDLKFLEDRWAGERFEFGCIYGTRRIGKTTLINKFLENKEAIYFQAKEASELENRRGLSRIIDKAMGYPVDYVFPTWDELLDTLLNVSAGRRFAFVIDEYPYLSKSTKKGISSYIQDFIDNKAKDSRLFIILMGSNVSFMEKELGNKKSPLYRRRTFSYKLGQLPYSEALLFLNKFADSEKLDYLSFFGFSPYYLSLLDANKDFKGNVKSLLFQTGATLLDAPDIILSNGTRERGIYNTVLSSIARGKKTPSMIAGDIEFGANEVSKYLKTLTEEEIVERKTMYGSKRKIIYRIKDPVLEFFYNQLFDDVERIRIGFGEVVFAEKEEFIHQFISHKFEDVCIRYLEEQSLTGKLAKPYYPIEGLRIDNSELGRSIELDGVSRYRDSLLVVECKYTEKKRIPKDYFDMKEDVSIKMFEEVKDFQFYLFAKNGFEKSFDKNSDQNLHLIDAATMLRVSEIK